MTEEARTPALPTRIRPATPADAPGLASLSGELGYPSTTKQVLARLTFLGDPDHEVLVAELGDGALAGFVDVHVLRLVEVAPIAQLGGLVVSGTQRRAGVGTALFAAAAAWARDRGFAALWVRSGATRHAAHRFYESRGCHPVKDQHVYELTL